MTLELANYEEQAREAIKIFWTARGAAMLKQAEGKKPERGNRGSATAGAHLNGFIELLRSLVVANGLGGARFLVERKEVVLPGFYRPTKLWDVLVMNGTRLVAAVEFKSQVGSFGNNYNNRTEEAIGSAQCLLTAIDKGYLRGDPPPFMGWLMVVEDSPKSRKPVKNNSVHFQVAPEFLGASYLDRYDLFCAKLVMQKLYNAAAMLATPKEAAADGAYREISKLSGLELFVTEFAKAIAIEAARQPPAAPPPAQPDMFSEAA